MIFPATTSFTPLSTISLPSPHILHPKSCNPAMDLIVLLSPLISASAPPPRPAYMAWKGKAKDVGERTKVSLWRTGGSRVWEVEVEGKVAGLSWSQDGLFLSILAIKTGAKSIQHLSVHTGEVIRSVPLGSDFDLDLPECAGVETKWVDMEWRGSGLDWKEPQNGSALMIIDSLPRVTPVLPPKPTNMLPFLRPTTTAPPKPTLHPSLLNFPALLPSNPPTPPDILVVSTRSFLTGTFPFPTVTNTHTSGHAVLALAQISNRITGFLDVVLRGLENAEQAFREGDKQTMICREDLETCAQQQAMTIPDVYADLFKFLMTGRSGVAVSEWLGSKLTGRTITKWDQVLDSSFRTIQNLISESISPALERLILLLEEVRGWSKWSYYTAELHLDAGAISRALDLVQGFTKLVDKMRKEAEHEMLAAAEFMKWLKYEITRAASRDSSSDDLPLATHDLKLVWSFMQNGFIHSVFHRHFPNLLERPPTDCLPDEYITYPRNLAKKLDEVLKETTSRLSVAHARDIGTSSTGADGSADSDASGTMSMSMSISMSMAEQEGQPDLDFDEDVDRDGDITPTQPLSDDDDDFSRGSSPDTVDRKDEPVDVEKEVVRVLHEEPWVWANTLVRDLDSLVRKAVGDVAGTRESFEERMNGLRDERTVGEGRWEAFVPLFVGVSQLWLLYKTSTTSKLAAFRFDQGEEGETKPLSMQFFDDEELVLLLESDGERYLVTLRYTDLEQGMSEVPAHLPVALDGLVKMGQGTIEHIDRFKLFPEGMALTSFAPQDIPPIPVPISRNRHLGPRPLDMSIDGPSETPTASQVGPQIALNGRQGRRLGCVISDQGREVEVWDLDVDEDDEDEDEEDMEE